MKVKEYARHVGANPRTVRRWMRDGLLEFIPPPKEHPHYARLIDSSQPRPKKRRKSPIKSLLLLIVIELETIKRTKRTKQKSGKAT